MIGNTISHYRITEKLGAGGMGVVYRAEDTKLDRQVAIKVLPDIFSIDPERLARFEREAKLLASLNHPNIAAIHGLEEAAGKRFLVLELVESETLAQRIAKGPLPVEEALEVCRQIAEGVEAAHEKGIIHRDLKPANVKITPEGKVKVLDFGLAKAFHAEPSAEDIAHSPTISEMTRPGVILGTAAYMSPEQARGKPVDKRADIWAFGCVLYECLSGKRPFQGDTITEIVASILKSEPDWTLLPVETPAIVRSLLRQCLQKDPKERMRDIGDARIEIEEALRSPATPAKKFGG
jgi:serine/threonine protein kinase